MTDPNTARAAALAAFDSYAVHPTSLVSYVSQGRLLVIGDSADIASVRQRLPANLTPTLWRSDVAGQPLLQGWLGAFRVAGLPEHDLVLDLSQPPLIRLPAPPPGYFATAGDAQRLDDALAQLAELTGEFDKPKYFNYRAEICAHHTAAVKGCQACLDVCGAAAIQPGDGRVTVTPQLCQGCGDCATACPSGALAYAYPSLSDTLERIRSMLRAWRQAGGAAPVLLLHAAAGADAWSQTETWLLPYPLEALGAAGMDVWLSALAYGAAAVWLWDDGGLSDLTRQNLEWQMGVANALLEAMGYGAECVQMAAGTALARAQIDFLKPSPHALSRREREINVQFAPVLSVERKTETPAAASHAGQNDKRSALRLALEHLHRHAPQPIAVVALGEGAPYGQLLLDAQRCTLCMACVSVCPASALQDGRDQPQLKFIEANCVQCARCANACPEQAIVLQPRYLFDAQQARQPRLLHQAEAFCCIDCGKPFASATMIQTITAKLKHHPMFQGEAARRLQLCEDCRVNAHFRHL